MGFLNDDEAQRRAQEKLAMPPDTEAWSHVSCIINGMGVMLPPSVYERIGDMGTRFDFSNIDDFLANERTLLRKTKIPYAVYHYFDLARIAAEEFAKYSESDEHQFDNIPSQLQHAFKQYRALPFRASQRSTLAHTGTVGEVAIDNWEVREIGEHRIGTCRLIDSTPINACYVESAHPNLDMIATKYGLDHPATHQFSSYDVIFQATTPQLRRAVHDLCGVTPQMLLQYVSRHTDDDGEGVTRTEPVLVGTN